MFRGHVIGLLVGRKPSLLNVTAIFSRCTRDDFSNIGIPPREFRRVAEASLIMLTVPFALVGGLWLIWILGYSFSVAVAVGFIALAGVAAEFGVVMLIYLDNAVKRAQASGALKDIKALDAALTDGALRRVRPKAMTVITILAGLLPIVLATGAGAATMQRIAAPMLGGMLSAPLLSLIVIPAIYKLWLSRGLKTAQGELP